MYRTSVLKLIQSEPLARFALAIPAAGTLIGSVLMACGGLVPCLVVDSFGLLCGLLILIGLVLKYLWIENLLIEGEEVEAEGIRLRDNPGIPISQTTSIDFRYIYDGVEYKRSITVHLPEDEHLQSATVVVDPERPESGIIKEIYCVPCGR